ncbi:glutathione S-transferase C-terminal domain-containing protein [Leisingera sp. SS27]|uniref:glutathione S-transferase family protein n=1 Tax=Leisingera sp. SS27 TaxID=2979462 RepID=UPI00232A9CA8|nr:glutathione S-transferase C-terminal domain-containing protein [Leisingera sp. SS27]MDC0657762.1 glutathione S-transferase C-terminal domain-containing protein [Leisingera sp. SS27]
MLINGILRDKPASADGRFQRLPSVFRSWIEAGPGATFPAASGRYHLYLSKACPWCHSVDLMLTFKGLRNAVSITWMDPVTSENGWIIDQQGFVETAGVPRDRYLFEVYQRAAPDFTGPVTVPLLLDKPSGRIVSTESADIMRMLDTSFGEAGATGPTLYPCVLQEEIDRLTGMIHTPICNGVYRAGFAASQTAYNEAVTQLFDALNKVEMVLEQRRYLAGEAITGIDLRLFPALVRFDPVYVTHFKTDRKRIADYPALSRYLRDTGGLPGVRETIDLPHIRAHYFQSHRHINPAGIIPIGPDSPFTEISSPRGTA